MNTLFHSVCLGRQKKPRPIWLMRQAGRYLEEYRQIRSQYPDFMDFCFSPEVVKTVTLQPIDRFDFDAAIIFSDILTIPHAMGQTVHFETGEGPKLIPFNNTFLVPPRLEILDKVYDGIRLTREALNQDKSLIGFSGTPWTLAAYMIHQEKIGDGVRLLQSLNNFDALEDLMNVLIENVTQHLLNQIQAGCDVVQIFDSWAGLCPVEQTNSLLKKPIEAILKCLHEKAPQAPVIYYGRHRCDIYATLDVPLGMPLVLGVDQESNLDALTLLRRPLQGNLDPDILIEGGLRLEMAIEKILEQTHDIPHIFNLGHGIKPQTPIENVQKMIAMVRRT
ncbi:MAG: Uroporphyrinogen decarboxylase [Holosporales bacterium]